MEVNDYLPTGVRVLSSEETSKTEPDAVTNAHELIEELELNTDIVFKYQDNNDSEELFKYILIKQCNALGKHNASNVRKNRRLHRTITTR